MPKEVLAVKAETKQIETAWIYFSEPSPHRPPEKKKKSKSKGTPKNNNNNNNNTKNKQNKKFDWNETISLIPIMLCQCLTLNYHEM